MKFSVFPPPLWLRRASNFSTSAMASAGKQFSTTSLRHCDTPEAEKQSRFKKNTSSYTDYLAFVYPRLLRHFVSRNDRLANGISVTRRAFGIIQHSARVTARFFSPLGKMLFGTTTDHGAGNASSKAFGINKNSVAKTARLVSQFLVSPKGDRQHKLYDFSRRAFGIIEVLISGVVVITVISVTMSVRQRSSGQSAAARHEAVAYMLAEEGVEALHHVRDNNYLAKLADGTRLPWNCDLNVKPTMDTASGTSSLSDCNGSIKNSGDFSLSGTTYSSFELGNGMQMGNIFRASDGTTVKKFPSWHLSFPTKFDAGTNGGVSTDDNMNADQCVGAERIFVSEGTVTATGAIIKENKRGPGAAITSGQDNKVTTGSCTDWQAPSGQFEYRRQIAVSALTIGSSVPNLGIKNESWGNLPASWNALGSDTGRHIVRALVRVSWRESSKVTGTDENAVLLATYLTDWRPSN